MTTRELLQMALNAMESMECDLPNMRHEELQVMNAIRAHLAKPEPEPVAWSCFSRVTGNSTLSKIYPSNLVETSKFCIEPLFTKDQL
jgi:hypothetical protein